MLKNEFTLGNGQEDSADPFGISMGDGAWNLMFIILVASISLVPATQTTFHDLDLKLAQSVPGDTADKSIETIRIVIDSKGQVRLDEKTLGSVEATKSQLVTTLKSKIQDRGSRPYRVWIVPDKGVPWQSIVDVHGAVSQVTDKFSVISEEKARDER